MARRLHHLVAGHRLGHIATEPTARQAPGRQCAHEGCTTKLTTYNRSDKCYGHDDSGMPRRRAKKGNLNGSAQAEHAVPQGATL